MYLSVNFSLALWLGLLVDPDLGDLAVLAEEFLQLLLRDVVRQVAHEQLQVVAVHAHDPLTRRRVLVTDPPFLLAWWSSAGSGGRGGRSSLAGSSCTPVGFVGRLAVVLLGERGSLLTSRTCYKYIFKNMHIA